LITDATGIPLAVTLTGGNRNDVTQLIPLLEAVPPVRGKRGRPRRRPDAVLGDRGYDHDKYRRLVRKLGVKPVIARRGTEHGSGLGTQRWVVERAFAHLHWFRRPRIRWEIRDGIHEAFLTLGCALICWRRLKSFRQEFLVPSAVFSLPPDQADPVSACPPLRERPPTTPARPIPHRARQRETRALQPADLAVSTGEWDGIDPRHWPRSLSMRREGRVVRTAR
jgi:transposase